MARFEARAAAPTHLMALRDDFDRNRALAESKISAEQRLEELGTALLAALEATNGPTASDELLLAAELSGWQYAMTYRRGAWDDLQSARASVALRNSGLRIALSEFYASVESQRRVEDEWLVHILAFRERASPSVPSGFRLAVLEWFPGWESGLAADGLADPADAASIIRGMSGSAGLVPRLVDVLIARAVASDVYSDDLRNIDALLQMIDEALGDL